MLIYWPITTLRFLSVSVSPSCGLRRSEFMCPVESTCPFMSYYITATADEQNETSAAQSVSRRREGWKGGGIVRANSSIWEQSCQGNRPKTRPAKETEVCGRSYDHVAVKEREDRDGAHVLLLFLLIITSSVTAYQHLQHPLLLPGTAADHINIHMSLMCRAATGL